MHCAGLGYGSGTPWSNDLVSTTNIDSIGNGFARVGWVKVSSGEAKKAKIDAGDVVRTPTLWRCNVWLARCR